MAGWIEFPKSVLALPRQNKFEVALVDASLLWGTQAKGPLLTHRVAAIWLDMSNTALDLGFSSSIKLPMISYPVFLAIQ